MIALKELYPKAIIELLELALDHNFKIAFRMGKMVIPACLCWPLIELTSWDTEDVLQKQQYGLAFVQNALYTHLQLLQFSLTGLDIPTKKEGENNVSAC